MLTFAAALACIVSTACGGSGESKETSPTARPSPHISTPTPEVLAFQYEVQEGDSLYALAVRFGTSVGEILAINKFSSPDELAAGQRILLQGSPTPHARSAE